MGVKIILKIVKKEIWRLKILVRESIVFFLFSFFPFQFFFCGVHNFFWGRGEKTFFYFFFAVEHFFSEGVQHVFLVDVLSKLNKCNGTNKGFKLVHLVCPFDRNHLKSQNRLDVVGPVDIRPSLE